MTDGRTDRRTDRRTDGGDCNIPNAFLKKRGDKKLSPKINVKNIKNRVFFFFFFFFRFGDFDHNFRGHHHMKAVFSSV